jgi:hypothetical protein
MAGRSSRSKGASKAAAKPTGKPAGGSPKRGKASTAPGGSGVLRRRGRREVIGGGALVLLGLALALPTSGSARYALVYIPIAIGVVAIAIGAARLSPRTDPPLPPRPDVRRWIYGGLDVLLGVVYALVIWKIIPNRLPSAAFHLWTLPVCTLAMGAGTLYGGRHGWWTAIAAGSALLLSIIVLIVRILISAAFLAGVYGAFGKAASTFAIVAVALIVEVVALLPIVQIKFLMTRAGRRAYGT